MIWLDFEADTSLTTPEQLKPELDKLLSHLFNQEAAHYMSFEGKLFPKEEGGSEVALYRLGIFFAVDFWKTITGNNAYVQSLEGLDAEIDLTGSLKSLIEGGAGLLLKGLSAGIAIDRQVLSTKALESMPEGIRGTIENALKTLPGRNLNPHSLVCSCLQPFFLTFLDASIHRQFSSLQKV